MSYKYMYEDYETAIKGQENRPQEIVFSSDKITKAWKGRVFYCQNWPGFYVIDEVFTFGEQVRLVNTMDKEVIKTIDWEQFLLNFKEKL